MIFSLMKINEVMFLIHRGSSMVFDKQLLNVVLLIFLYKGMLTHGQVEWVQVMLLKKGLTEP